MFCRIRKVTLIILAIFIALGLHTSWYYDSGFLSKAYASTIFVSSKIVGAATAVQGDQNILISIEVENKENNPFTFDSSQLDLSPAKEITISGGNTGTIKLEKGQKASINFYLNVNRFATTGLRQASLILRNQGEIVHQNYSIGRINIYEKIATPEKGTGNYVAALDVSHAIKPSEGFATGGENMLTLEIYNNGNTIIKNATMTLTLPDGLSVHNSSDSENLGSVSTGTKREVSFPIKVENNVQSKNYPIKAVLTGLSYTNNEVSIEKTFYIPVIGGGTSTKNIDISNINIPNQVVGKEDFTLSFSLVNNNSIDLKNLKVTAEIPEGLLNKSKNIFVESNLPGKSSKDYSIVLFAQDSSKEGTYPIKIAVEPLDKTDSNNEGNVQYTSVYIKGLSGSSKTPQLMVDRYNYGSSSVQAGDEFNLNLGLYNTSSNTNLSNIKVSLSSDDGTFIPVNSSNSFYIAEIEALGNYTKNIRLKTKPDSKQETSIINIDMSYEDGSGNSFNAKDVISIPLVQEDRLQVDEIIAPPELYAYMQSGVSVQFYNMGKTVLNNLRVTAEGDFDTPESTSYFVGNMESGKSDYYDFSFIPRAGGTMTGKVIFTYEDTSGNMQILEKPFEFQVMDEMPVFDEGMPPMEEPGQGNSKPVIFGLIAFLIIGSIAGIIGWKKHKKKKMDREMAIDE